MKLKELKNIINVDTIKIYLKSKNDYFINNNGIYETIGKDSLNMWFIYGEYEIKKIDIKDEILIIDIE